MNSATETGQRGGRAMQSDAHWPGARVDKAAWDWYVEASGGEAEGHSVEYHPDGDRYVVMVGDQRQK